MLSTCANPACAKPFLYLREGRIFEADTQTGDVRPVLELSLDPGPQIEFHHDTSLVELRAPANKELLWWCGSCCVTRTITFAKNGGLALVSLRAAMHAAA